MNRDSFFAALARLVTGKPWTILIVSGVLALLATILAARLEVKTGFKDTMSKDEPVVRAWDYMAENFPGAFAVQVTVSGHDTERLIAVAKELEAGFRTEPALVRDVYLEQPVDFLARHSLLFLPTDELREFEANFNERSLGMGALLADPSSIGTLRALADMTEASFPSGATWSLLTTRMFGSGLVPNPSSKALGLPGVELDLAVRTDLLRDQLSERAIEAIKDVPLPPSSEAAERSLGDAIQSLALVADVLEQGNRVDPTAFRARVDRFRDRDWQTLGLPERYNVSADRAMLLMEVGAVEDITRLDRSRPFLAHVRGVIGRIAAENHDVQIGLTGFAPAYEQEAAAVMDSSVIVTILGFIGILGVFVIGFERVALPSLSGIPLVVAVLWTLGIHALVIGELNALTVTFPVINFGLGIEYGIHLMSEYAAHRHAGKSPASAMEATFVRSGPGLVTGGLSTAAAFFALIAGSYRGIRELGLIAGTGILMSLVAMFLVLPAIMILRDRRGESRGPMLSDVPFPALGRLGHWLEARRYAVLATGMGLTVFFAYFIPFARLDYNPLNLSPAHLPANDLQEVLLEKFGLMGEVEVMFANDLEEAERLRKAADAAQSVGPVMSLSSLIPDDQAAKAEVLESIALRFDTLVPTSTPVSHTYDAGEIAELRHHLGRLKLAALDLSLVTTALYGDDVSAKVAELRDVLNRIDRRIGPASAERLRYLDTLLSAEIARSRDIFRDTLSTREVGIDDLPSSLLGRLRGKDGRFILMMRASEQIFDKKVLDMHIAELTSISPDVSGLLPVWKRMLDAIIADLPVLFVVTGLVVGLLVLLDFRRVRPTLLALLPVALGLTWTVGMMGLLDVPFNVVSIVAIPLIVGLGIDAGVHLIHRIHTEHDVAAALLGSGKALILAALANGIGFGSLLLSEHRGIRSMGLVTAIGVTACMVAALLLLPALVPIFDEKAVRKPVVPG